MDNDFIMSPKVDFAFKEIMTNEKVRTGFLSIMAPLSRQKSEIFLMNRKYQNVE